MYEVPGSNVVAVTVDKGAVLGNSSPRYTYSPSSNSDVDDNSSLSSQNISQKKKAL